MIKFILKDGRCCFSLKILFVVFFIFLDGSCCFSLRIFFVVFFIFVYLFENLEDFGFGWSFSVI